MFVAYYVEEIIEASYALNRKALFTEGPKTPSYVTVLECRKNDFTTHRYAVMHMSKWYKTETWIWVDTEVLSATSFL